MKFILLGMLLLWQLTPLTAAEQGLKDADLLYRLSLSAMEKLDSESTESVQSALNLGKARAIYTTHNKPEQIRECNAFIFYCMKKTDSSKIDTYIKSLATSEKEEARNQLEIFSKEIAQDLSADKTQELFIAAKKFADNNNEEHLLIHIRFYEIAERGLASSAKVAIESNRKSSSALQEWVATKSGGTIIATSPFATIERQLDLFGSEIGLALSDTRALKKISRALQAEHKAKIKGPFKRQTALEFFKIARESLDQPDYSYCIAKEAAALAGDKKVADISLLMEVAAFISKNFANRDQRALQFQLLKASRAKIAKKALTLLDNPDDQAANAQVGLSYCLLSDNWKEGLSMLARSGDPILTAICAMEQAGSKIANEQRQIGDAWFDMSKNKSYKSYRALITARSSYWYIKAKPDLKGISKEQIAKRIIQAGRILPIKGLEGYPNMFSKARPGSMPQIDIWMRLVGKLITVDARKRSQYTGVDLLPGQAIRVVANVKERWTVGSWGGNYLGTGYRYSGDSWNEGMILVRVGAGPWTNPKEAITGEGKVFVRCWRGGNSSSNGKIHVKVIKMQ